MCETQIKIGEIRQALNDSVRQQKETARNFRERIIFDRKEIKEVPIDVRLYYKSISPLEETGALGDAEFSGFRGDSEGDKDRRQFEIGVELKGQESELWIFNDDTGRRGEARMQYGGMEDYLARRISLSMGLGN